MKNISVFTYDDDKCQDVPDYLLGQLIAAGRIKSFRRASGWVVIGLDPIREPDKWAGGYEGPERRSMRIKSCILCPDMVNGECVSEICPHRLNLTTKVYSSGNFQ